MKKYTWIYYILVGIPVLVISALALIDSVRAGELKTTVRDPGLWLIVVGSFAALALAVFYLVRRGTPTSADQFGCVFMIALGLVALVAVIVAFIFIALTGGA